MSTKIEQFTKAPNPLEDQEVFDVDMARYITETLRFVTQANTLGQEMQINADVAAALILAMALPQFAGTSTSSVTVGTGPRTFVTQAGKGWLPGQVVVVSSGANYVKGTVTDYTGTNLQLNVTSINGSGTFTAWGIGLSYDGLVLAKSGDNNDITRLLALADIPAIIKQYARQIQSLPDPTLAGNALTLPASTHSLDFRSATLASGLPTTVTGTAAALTIPAGATLGTSNGVQGIIVEVICNNGGTLHKAVVNLAGGNDLSESGVISTTAITAGATAANVFYSNTALTNVPYRLVRSITSTQATAGLWATTPSLVQGAGGNALTSMQSWGYGQSTQDLSGSRSSGVTYYNTTSKPIQVGVTVIGSAIFSLSMTVGGRQVDANYGNAGWVVGVGWTVSPGESYSVTWSGASLSSWSEKR